VSVTIASPTPDEEAAAAKLVLRLREHLAATGRPVPATGVDLVGLVVSGPRESTDSHGRRWYWFRGTLRVGDRPGDRTDAHGVPVAVRTRPASVWQARPVPRWHGDGWACSLPTAAAAADARRELRKRLERASAGGHCTTAAGEDLLLAFEELTSNAFRHGTGAVHVTIAGTGVGWLLVVDDEAPDRPPVPPEERDEGLGGMGLDMVAGLSRRFGWQACHGRKSVWAELPSHR
jgi:hypothetical protein